GRVGLRNREVLDVTAQLGRVSEQRPMTLAPVAEELVAGSIRRMQVGSGNDLDHRVPSRVSLMVVSRATTAAIGYGNSVCPSALSASPAGGLRGSCSDCRSSHHAWEKPSWVIARMA